ncbi:ATP-binding protein [Wenjunlia tyrosinilytica]|uniref:Histidine kinase/HSP90-like ATPase domain-containing protein n=1 Tax=Wenjunlia tyrosinilytica TaxID=1544741 RepID=A0A917ZW67_9ACTN|nr:ATP-binding protein [Wenjunlia tyrosinilytica]GGO93474.1 hypothetical protein GCM10012280_46100 [Wenjunlia tyrosinilytica]
MYSLPAPTTTARQRKACFSLPTAAEAPRTARRLTQTTLAQWRVPADSVETVRLLVSELVTNAVTHGQGPLTFSLLLTQLPAALPVLRVEVTDTCAKPARRAKTTDRDEHGRGLGLVEALSDHWGQAPHARGKQIWCEVTPPPSTTTVRTPMPHPAGATSGGPTRRRPALHRRTRPAVTPATPAPTTARNRVAHASPPAPSSTPAITPTRGSRSG